MDRNGGYNFMFFYNVLFVVILILFSSASYSNQYTWEYSNNSYRFHLVPISPSDPSYRSPDYRVNPPTTTTTRLLREGFRYTPGGAVRTLALTLAGGALADYVWNEAIEWWDRELVPELPPESSLCTISMYSQHTVSSSQAGEYIAACGFLGGTVFYPNSSFSYMSCLDGIIPYKLANGHVWDAAIVPAQVVIDDCLADSSNEPTPAIRVPLSDAEFSDMITSQAPETAGLPMIQNIPTDVVDDIVGVDPTSDSDTATRRSTPSSSISPTSSRQPETVTTYDPITGAPTAKTEWPAFCTWAAIVCEFIDWYTEPLPDEQPEDIPTEEVGELQNYDSGLSGGACPAGVNFTIGGETVNYSFQPACDAMIWFRPILLGMCTLIAGFILVGHKQG